MNEVETLLEFDYWIYVMPEWDFVGSENLGSGNLWKVIGVMQMIDFHEQLI